MSLDLLGAEGLRCATRRGEFMSKAVEYRKHAGECRALARNVQNEEHRNQLLKMADAWDNFAVESERSERARQTVG